MAACKLTWFAPPTAQICETVLSCFREEKLQQKDEQFYVQLSPLDS